MPLRNSSIGIVWDRKIPVQSVCMSIMSLNIFSLPGRWLVSRENHYFETVTYAFELYILFPVCYVNNCNDSLWSNTSCRHHVSFLIDTFYINLIFIMSAVVNNMIKTLYLNMEHCVIPPSCTILEITTWFAHARIVRQHLHFRSGSLNTFISDVNYTLVIDHSVCVCLLIPVMRLSPSTRSCSIRIAPSCSDMLSYMTCTACRVVAPPRRGRRPSDVDIRTCKWTLHIHQDDYKKGITNPGKTICG